MGNNFRSWDSLCQVNMFRSPIVSWIWPASSSSPLINIVLLYALPCIYTTDLASYQRVGHGWCWASHLEHRHPAASWPAAWRRWVPALKASVGRCCRTPCPWGTSTEGSWRGSWRGRCLHTPREAGGRCRCPCPWWWRAGFHRASERWCCRRAPQPLQ